MNDEVPLICDPVPGADVFVSPYEHDLSDEEMSILIKDSLATSEADLSPSEIKAIVGDRGAVWWSDHFVWPDAEFCAA